MNTKAVIINIGTNKPLIVPKSVSHRCTIPNIKESTKELEVMDIEWSKAPEGATHYVVLGGDVVYYKIKDDDIKAYHNTWVSDFSEKEWLVDNAFRISNETQPTLTYTQAMADNGELPSVGMKFIYCDSTNTKNNAIVTYASEWNIVFKCLDDGFSKDVELAKEISGLDIIRQILPLTPPVELIDGKAYQFDYSHHADYYNIQGVYNEEELAFFSVRDVLLAEYCTNIQPLTVEVK